MKAIRNIYDTWVRTYRHKKIISKISLLNPDDTILDLSCGDGLFIDRIHKRNPNTLLYGIDISEIEIQKAQRDFPYGHFSVGGVEKLPFENNSLDVVFCVMSLHHYKNAESVFSEIKRILKNGGVLYLGDMTPRFLWTQRIANNHGCYEPYHFERYYLSTEIKQVMNQAGLLFVKEQSITWFPRVRLFTFKK